jgi:hypothetical protein
MWLPPLRPVLPEDAPVGISMGTFKPQREMDRAFWPGPPSEVLGIWEPLEHAPSLHSHPWKRHSAVLGVTGALLVVAGLAGAAVSLMT